MGARRSAPRVHTAHKLSRRPDQTYAVREERAGGSAFIGGFPGTSGSMVSGIRLVEGDVHPGPPGNTRAGGLGSIKGRMEADRLQTPGV